MPVAKYGKSNGLQSLGRHLWDSSRESFRGQKHTYPTYPTSFVSRRHRRLTGVLLEQWEQKPQAQRWTPSPRFHSKRPSQFQTRNATKGLGYSHARHSFSHSSPQKTPTSHSSLLLAVQTQTQRSVVWIRGMDRSPAIGVIERFQNTHPLKTKMFAFATWTVPSSWWCSFLPFSLLNAPWVSFFYDLVQGYVRYSATVNF